jgi:hypothetical protein
MSSDKKMQLSLWISMNLTAVTLVSIFIDFFSLVA